MIPLYKGRCKIRVFGYILKHICGQYLILLDDLPWSHLLQVPRIHLMEHLMFQVLVKVYVNAMIHIIFNTPSEDKLEVKSCY